MIHSLKQYMECHRIIRWRKNKTTYTNLYKVSLSVPYYDNVFLSYIHTRNYMNRLKSFFNLEYFWGNIKSNWIAREIVMWIWPVKLTSSTAKWFDIRNNISIRFSVLQIVKGNNVLYLHSKFLMIYSWSYSFVLMIYHPKSKVDGTWSYY